MQVVDCMTVRTSLFARMVVVLLLAVTVAPGLAGAQEQERSAIPAETLIEAARAALAEDKLDDAEFLLKGVRRARAISTISTSCTARSRPSGANGRRPSPASAP